ncbi:MAG: hypothetical protein ACKVOH_04950 [Chlamydiales bacterium]
MVKEVTPNAKISGHEPREGGPLAESPQATQRLSTGGRLVSLFYRIISFPWVLSSIGHWSSKSTKIDEILAIYGESANGALRFQLVKFSLIELGHLEHYIAYASKKLEVETGVGKFPFTPHTVFTEVCKNPERVRFALSYVTPLSGRNVSKETQPRKIGGPINPMWDTIHYIGHLLPLGMPSALDLFLKQEGDPEQARQFIQKTTANSLAPGAQVLHELTTHRMSPLQLDSYSETEVRLLDCYYECAAQGLQISTRTSPLLPVTKRDVTTLLSKEDPTQTKEALSVVMRAQMILQGQLSDRRAVLLFDYLARYDDSRMAQHFSTWLDEIEPIRIAEAHVLGIDPKTGQPSAAFLQSQEIVHRISPDVHAGSALAQVIIREITERTFLSNSQAVQNVLYEAVNGPPTKETEERYVGGVKILSDPEFGLQREIRYDKTKGGIWCTTMEPQTGESRSLFVPIPRELQEGNRLKLLYYLSHTPHYTADPGQRLAEVIAATRELDLEREEYQLLIPLCDQFMLQASQALLDGGYALYKTPRVACERVAQIQEMVEEGTIYATDKGLSIVPSIDSEAVRWATTISANSVSRACEQIKRGLKGERLVPPTQLTIANMGEVNLRFVVEVREIHNSRHCFTLTTYVGQTPYTSTYIMGEGSIDKEIDRLAATGRLEQHLLFAQAHATLEGGAISEEG